VHDPDTGELAGGVLGRTSMGLFFLDLSYLPKKLRRGGLGSHALRMAEDEAIRLGGIWPDRHHSGRRARFMRKTLTT
jgi:hypothetical protein